MTRGPAFSLIMPYHNNPGMLSKHYLTLDSLPPEIKRGLEVRICDDASDPAERALYPRDDIGVPIHLYRIEPPHVRWSHRCATNIAAHHARGYWFLLTDIDHVVPEETWRGLMHGKERPFLRTDRAYQFARRNADGSSYKPHPDTWLVHCSLWETLGGYDERYRGHYGQNYAFIERVRRVAHIDTLPLHVIRYSRDDIPDASERVLDRKCPEDKAAVATLRRQFRREGTFYDRHALTAPYVVVPQ